MKTWIIDVLFILGTIVFAFIAFVELMSADIVVLVFLAALLLVFRFTLCEKEDSRKD